jgi:hypothetical protein
MKTYAYILLNGINGTVIRCHHYGHPGTDGDSVNRLLALGYAPVRELLLANNSVLLVLDREEQMHAPRSKRSARARSR